jgi:putative heme-binding domain-containing protein
LTNFEQPLLRLTTNRMAGVDARAAAARAVASFNAAPAADAIASVLNDGREPLLLREKFAGALGEMPGGASGAALVGAFKTAPARLQSVLAGALAANTANADLLLAAAADGRVPARLLQERALRDKLAAAKVPDFETRLAKLTKDLPAADEARLKLLDQRRKDFARAQVAADRGAAVFEKNCAACHQIDGKGALVGPQLDGVGARGVERIIEDILDPNRNVDTAFRTTMFIMKDDDVASGLLRREEGELVIYAEATGKEQSLKKNQIKERRQSELSLMPDNFAETIPANEFHDLIAFLLTKNGAKK